MEIGDLHDYTYTRVDPSAFIERVRSVGVLVGSRAINVHTAFSDWDYLVEAHRVPEVNVDHLKNYVYCGLPTLGFKFRHEGEVFNLLVSTSKQEHRAWQKTQATWLLMIQQSPAFAGVVKDKRFRVAAYQALREMNGLG